MENVLLTTAISYTNGKPHVGHLYESVLADFVKKSFGLFSNAMLLTGTDEHGKKIQNTARDLNMEPIELCNMNSAKFKTLNDRLGVNYNLFIRTTQTEHKDNVTKSILQSNQSGDIYLSNYTGYYNVREETFITDLEAQETDYKDPITNIPYEKVVEESYFFKLNKYKSYIMELLENELVFPSNRFSIGERLDNLKDLSISRTSFDWGIKFPLTSSKDHIVYVWFDALLNYVTGAKILNTNFDKTIHIIGKDILWFHAVIYPAILKSCGYDTFQAKNILVHGFILDKNGVKMSKSLNNVIDVDYILDKYCIEAIRYYLIMETTWGEDIKFNEDRMKDMYNNELIKSFGNMYQRLFTLGKPLQNEINQYLMINEKAIAENREIFMNEIRDIVTTYSHTRYKSKILSICSFVNKELTDKKPWEKTFNPDMKVELLAELFIQLSHVMTLLYPIIPNKITELRTILGYKEHNNYMLNMTSDKVKAFISL